jgi:uncharacterized protein
VHRDAAEAALGATTVLGARYPRAAGWGLAAATALLAGPVEIALVDTGSGGADVSGLAALERTAWMSTSPGAVIAIGNAAGAPGWAPLLEGREAIDGAPTAYVCRQFVCRLPVTTVAELRVALEQASV